MIRFLKKKEKKKVSVLLITPRHQVLSSFTIKYVFWMDSYGLDIPPHQYLYMKYVF